MIVLLDRPAAARGRPTVSLPPIESRSVVLGLASPPARSFESDWPKWLLSFDNAHLSEARSGHRRSRRSD